MQAWWESLTALERVFAAAAIPATLLLIIQLVSTLIGLGGQDGDADGPDLDGTASPTASTWTWMGTVSPMGSTWMGTVSRMSFTNRRRRRKSSMRASICASSASGASWLSSQCTAGEPWPYPGPAGPGWWP